MPADGSNRPVCVVHRTCRAVREAYSHIFELLLRLKANYFWPAMWASAFNEDDPQSPQLRCDEVFDNQRWLASKSASPVKAGKHTLRVIMVDPEVVLEQVVINPDNSRYSYFGASL